MIELASNHFFFHPSNKQCNASKFPLYALLTHGTGISLIMAITLIENGFIAMAFDIVSVIKEKITNLG